MGLFVAKCIQDGRRVDLPLSRSFFKLMCSPREKGVASSVSDETSEEDEAPPTCENQESDYLHRTDMSNDNADHQSNQTFDQLSNSNQRFGSGMGSGNETYEASRQRVAVQHGEAGLKEAELVLNANMDEITKERNSKEDVMLEQLSSSLIEGGGGAVWEGPWFEGILKREDLDEVSLYRSRFLKQLDELVKQRDVIQRDLILSRVEKERQVAGLTLPGSEENIPGAKLEDLWYIFYMGRRRGVTL